MTSTPTISDTASDLRRSSRARPVEDSRERLRLKPKAPTTGWWTVGGSRDRGILAAELPSLLRSRGERSGD